MAAGGWREGSREEPQDATGERRTDKRVAVVAVLEQRNALQRRSRVPLPHHPTLLCLRLCLQAAERGVVELLWIPRCGAPHQRQLDLRCASWCAELSTPNHPRRAAQGAAVAKLRCEDNAAGGTARVGPA